MQGQRNGAEEALAKWRSQFNRLSRSQDLQEQRADATYIATSLFQADGSHSYSR